MVLVAIVLLAGAVSAGPQRRGGPPTPPITPDPSRVLAPGAEVQKIAGDFAFTEGPTVDQAGNVYFVDQPNDRILKYDTSGNLTTFMQPSGRSNGMSFDPQGVYFYSREDQRLVLLADDLMQANGIIGTPDGRQLYVADIRARQTFVYDINADGTLGNKQLFCEFGSDGMTIDSEHNIYLTTGGAVQVFDRTGERIETIAVPENPANVVFGGADRQTLFITARTGFYAVKARVRGADPQ
jgi:gluconolactonase